VVVRPPPAPKGNPSRAEGEAANYDRIAGGAAMTDRAAAHATRQAVALHRNDTSAVEGKADMPRVSLNRRD